MNETTKTENMLKERFRGNLQIILAIGAVGGLVIGIANFFILTAISPIEKRVVALEKISETNLPYVNEFIEVKTNVQIIKDDIKDIKTFLKVR